MRGVRVAKGNERFICGRERRQAGKQEAYRHVEGEREQKKENRRLSRYHRTAAVNANPARTHSGITLSDTFFFCKCALLDRLLYVLGLSVSDRVNSWSSALLITNAITLSCRVLYLRSSRDETANFVRGVHWHGFLIEFDPTAQSIFKTFKGSCLKRGRGSCGIFFS